MQTKRQIQRLLSSANVSPNRRLGQHFLVDLNLMRLLVDSADIRSGDVVLEGGTGTGSLTEELVERAGRVVGVELDRALATIARSRLEGTSNVEILETDVLSNKGALSAAVVQAVAGAREEIGETGPVGRMCARAEGPTQRVPLRLVSNLPYDVASPVLINLVKGPLKADAMCVTVQKEVADRMIAAPGSREYGTLSILLGATGHVETVRVLGPAVFWPPPQVDSAIVRYIRDENRCREIADIDLFARVATLLIGHRRKMLRACIRHAEPELGGRDIWLPIFEQCGIDPTRRAEQLSPEQFVALANTVRDRLMPL